MAEAPTRRGRVGGLHDIRWSASAGPLAGVLQGIVTIALWATAVRSMEAVFQPGPWQWALLLMVAGAFVPALGLRLLSPQRPLMASSAGCAVAAGVLAHRLWSSGAMEAWHSDPAGRLASARSAVLHGEPPMVLTGAVEDVILVFAMLLVWIGVLLHIGSEAPTLGALVPSAGLLLRPAVTGVHESPVVLAAVALGWMLLLVLGSPAAPPWGRRWAERARGAVRVWGARSAVGALALVLAAGALTQLPTTSDKTWNQTGIVPSPVDTTIPDVTVALGQELRRGSTAEAFRYSGVSNGQVTRFTLSTLADLDRGRWKPVDVADGELQALDSARSGADPTYSGALEMLPANGGTERINPGDFLTPPVTVITKGLVSPWLPTLQSTVLVDLPTSGAAETTKSSGAPSSPGPGAPQSSGDDETPSTPLPLDQWAWVPGTDSVRSATQVTQRGQTYRLWGSTQERLPLTPVAPGLGTADQQAAATGRQPKDLPRHLALPEGVPDVIGRTAAEVTRGASDDLAAAAALEQFFTGGGFTYDESAPYTPGADPEDPYQSMEAFLADRHGYCVHFASTFAVMARTLGIPSRVAVGYASRAASGPWTSVVGRDLHAWPEIHVDGAGWVAFEPTPGGAGWRAETGEDVPATPQSDPAQSGGAQSAGGTAPQEQSAGAAAHDQEASAAQPQPGDTGAQSGSGGRTDDEGATPGVHVPAWVFGVLLGAVGLGVFVCVPRLVRARRRGSRAQAVRRGRAEAAWDEVVDMAVDLGQLPVGLFDADTRERPRARTPEAQAEFLRSCGALGGSGVPDAPSVPRATGASGASGAGPEVEAALATLLEAVDAQLWGPKATSAQVPATVPASVLARTRDVLLRTLRSSAPARARARATWLPASVLGPWWARLHPRDRPERRTRPPDEGAGINA
ncbi:transglutaminase domain-containing protein [Schaalia sp. 19OD2882]|uniref:transglutaminase domain-containing protein n=1 Tax=Schaalia sp. 19OD2882 TaxID=2794089 RepID=UPI001C1EBC14|nr:transglutaminase domain-containing protein [Schaalia sp. 19OD2882]QWW19684.1 transglutaminase domain-containing protein [Schaalia sp. 19OD2882]